MTDTIQFPDAPSAAEQQKRTVNQGYVQRDFNFIPAPNEKWACVMIKLHPSVTPEDYVALRTAILDIAGLQDVKLVIDTESLPELEDDTIHQYRLSGSVNISIEDR